MAKTAKKASSKTAKTSAPSQDGYKGHRAGSLKEKLHKIFDATGGDEKGRAQALKLDVSPGTVTTSFSQFRKAAGTSRKPAAKKAAPKKAARKAPAKKAA